MSVYFYLAARRASAASLSARAGFPAVAWYVRKMTAARPTCMMAPLALGPRVASIVAEKSGRSGLVGDTLDSVAIVPIAQMAAG